MVTNNRGRKEEEEELKELKDPASLCCEYWLADHYMAQAIRQQKKTQHYEHSTPLLFE